MSAELLRKAATILRERAEAAHPGPWSAADEHGLLPEAWPAWCVSQMRPGYESMSPVEGYVCDIADVLGDDKDRNPNADYIATMHPGVGLALADWLDTAGADLWAYGPLCECGSGCNVCDDSLWEPHARRALDVARLIVGEQP